MENRARRLRYNQDIRKLSRETRLSPSSLILPIFLKEGKNIKSPITSLDGQFHYSPDRVFDGIEAALKSGVNKVLLFGLPEHKDEIGSEAFSDEGIIQQGIRAIKERYKDEVYIVGDVCMCEYTCHGHCGILDGDYVDNDKTLDYLAKIAVSQAKAGADMIAP